MQDVQLLDVGFYSSFFAGNIDTIGTERIGDYVVMVTQFGCDCISSWGSYPSYDTAAYHVRWLMSEDAKDGSSYGYEIWHLVDDAPEYTEDATSNLLLSSFVPIHDKSLPLYNVECNKWSEMLAWIGAMLPVIDMASYELKTSAV